MLEQMQVEIKSLTVWTIGHSSHSSEKFGELLQAAGIRLLVDVRRFAGSRRHPQFGQQALAEFLATLAITYEHLPSLGGRRSQRLAESPNNAWRVESFNAYADHMQSGEFREGIGQLLAWAATRRAAVMCAEAMPWQCHRRLIADYLVAHGHTVLDIFPSGAPRPHKLTDMARVQSGVVTYPQHTLF